MSAPPEGTAWFSKTGLKNAVFDPSDPKQFYQYLLVEVALNGDEGNVRPKDWKHPRSDNPGTKTPYWKFNVMYGRNADSIDRVQTIYQDISKAGTTLEAGFLAIPMPNEDERFFWIDLTFGVRGIFFPICHAAPEPYRHLCKYVCMDFKHRDVSIPFTRPYRDWYYPYWARGALKREVEKGSLELIPCRPIQEDNTPHPYLPDISRFNEGILGEKPGSKKRLFQDPSPETVAAKRKVSMWLEEGKHAPMSEGEEQGLEQLNETAEKYGLERTHKYPRNDVWPRMSEEETKEFYKTFKREVLYEPGDDKIQPKSTKKDSVDTEPLDERQEVMSSEESGPMLHGQGKPFSAGSNYCEGHLANIRGDEEFEQITRETMGNITVERMVKCQEEYSVLPNALTSREGETWPAALQHRRVDIPDPVEGGVGRQDDQRAIHSPAMLSDVDLDPDGVCCGRVNIKTTTKLGLGFQPLFTLRFDVKELSVLLAIPSTLKRAQAKDGTGSADPAPIDVYDTRLVVAFASEEVKVTNATQVTDKVPPSDTFKPFSATKPVSQPARKPFNQPPSRPVRGLFGNVVKTLDDIIVGGISPPARPQPPPVVRDGGGRKYDMALAINYTSYINGEFGLEVQYVPQPKSVGQQWWEFFGQIASIGLSFIPVVGPMLSFATYVVIFVVTDPGWINGFENIGPAIFGLLLAHKGTMGKYLVKGANKLNKMPLGA